MNSQTLGTLALAAIGLSACLPAAEGGGGGGVVLIGDDTGGGERDAGGEDAGVDPGEEDGGVEPAEDGGVQPLEDVGETLPEGCAFEGFDVKSSEAKQGASRFTYTASGEEGAGGTDQIYFLVEDGPIEPGVYPFEAESFADCTTCFVVQTGCDDDGCGASFMARSGSVEVVTVEPRFKARVRDLRLDAVVINEGGTRVLGGDAYCMIEPLEFEAPLEVDPCSGWAEPTFVDTNCGPASLSVTWDVSGTAADFDRFESVEWDFGDGTSSRSFSDTTVTHQYARGEWNAEARIVGFYGDTRVTIKTPELIRAH